MLNNEQTDAQYKFAKAKWIFFFCQKGHFKNMIVSIGDVNVKGGVYPVWWVKIASGLQ